MAQDFVGHGLGEQTQEDDIVVRLPQCFPRLGQCTHEALGLISRQRLCDDSVALVFDQAAQFAGSDPAGGLIGKVVKVGDTELEVELAPSVKVRVVRSTVTQVLAKSAPAEA